MTSLHIDLETRSAVDLKKTGAYPYSEDASSDVWCAAFAMDDEPVKLWHPGIDDRDVRHAIKHAGTVCAWNANFERTMFAGLLGPRYGWPQPVPTAWRCGMVSALAMAMPAGLGDCANALGLPITKDDAGKRLMMQMAKPRKPRKDDWTECPTCTGSGKFYPHDDFNVEEFCPQCEGDGQIPPTELLWWDDAERRERLYAYCKQDVEVERMIERHLLPLRKQELDLWHLDQKINDRGIHVDVDLCHKALSIVDTAAKWLNDELREITNGQVAKTTAVAQIIAWLAGRDVHTDSLDKEHLGALLERTDLSPEVRRVLEIRAEGAKAAVKKIAALLAGTSSDGRARGLLQFHAASTGRWAGRRFQPQNIARPKKPESVPAYVAAIETGSADYIRLVEGEPLAVVSDCLRALVGAAPGRVIEAADYQGIEGRLIAWLAGEEWKIQSFRNFDAGTGFDSYVMAYARAFNVAPADVDKLMRQIGKVMELALGYQGGVGAFQKMAIGYGVVVSDERADELKNLWRDAHPQVVQMWAYLETAAQDAIASPGVTYQACNGRIAFRVAGTFLYMRLPSGRAICYPFPRMTMMLMPWTKNGELLKPARMVFCPEDGEEVLVPAVYEQLPVWKNSICYKGVDPYTRQWSDQFAHGGLLANNAVQGTARDIEAEAMPRVENAGYPIVLTVHDEIVSETPKDFGSVEEFESLMVTLPAWAEGLPLAASAWTATRYRK